MVGGQQASQDCVRQLQIREALGDQLLEALA